MKELHEMPKGFRKTFLEEMGLVAEAVFMAFRPDKLNYELLGNTDRHCHWHIFPRHENDPDPKRPVWVIDKEVRNSDQARPDAHALASLKKRLGQALETLLKDDGE